MIYAVIVSTFETKLPSRKDKINNYVPFEVSSIQFCFNLESQLFCITHLETMSIVVFVSRHHHHILTMATINAIALEDWSEMKFQRNCFIFRDDEIHDNEPGERRASVLFPSALGPVYFPCCFDEYRNGLQCSSKIFFWLHITFHVDNLLETRF